MRLALICFLLGLAPLTGLPPSPTDLRVTHLKSPNYNVVARFGRLQGDVKLQVSVAKDGAVSKVEVSESNAGKLLQDHAIENMREWKFNPGEERVFVIVYEFRLVMPEIDHYPPSVVTVDFPDRVRIECNFATVMKD
jgi:TonB family protein